MKKKLSTIQGLRFIGFLLIFLNHASWLIAENKYFDFGARGVEIFLVLSSYMVAYNYSDRIMPNSRGYSIRYMFSKVKKFYFLHIITFLAMTIYVAAHIIKQHGYPGGTGQLVIDAVLNVTLLKSWYWPSAFSFNGVTWFLSTILFAYLLVPKLIHWEQRKRGNEKIVFFLMVITAKLFLDTCGYPLHLNPWPNIVSLYTFPAYRFLDFLVGYMAYTVFHEYQDTSMKMKHLSVLPWLVLIIYFVSCRLFNPIWVPAEFLLLTVLLIQAFTVEKGAFSKIFGSKIMVHLGNISFELYIIHVVVISYFARLMHNQWHFPGWITMILLFLITVGLAELCHRPKIRKFMTVTVWEKCHI